MENKNDLEKLNKNINDLNKSVISSNSFWKSFLRGVLGGVGGAIGATIIFAILLGILSKTIKSIEDIPILNKLITDTHVENVLDKNSIKD